MTAINPLRGEAVLEAGGETFKLTLDVNAFCHVQAALDLKPRELVATFEEEPDDLVVARGLLWGALQKHHSCHIVQAGEIMADAGLPQVRVALAECLAACFGSAEGKQGGNPRRGRKTPGTG